MGQYIPDMIIRDEENLVTKATLTASSEYHFKGFPADGEMLVLDESVAQMIPLQKGMYWEKCKLIFVLRRNSFGSGTSY